MSLTEKERKQLKDIENEINSLRKRYPGCSLPKVTDFGAKKAKATISKLCRQRENITYGRSLVIKVLRKMKISASKGTGSKMSGCYLYHTYGYIWNTPWHFTVPFNEPQEVEGFIKALEAEGVEIEKYYSNERCTSIELKKRS